jgi:hypothetical protein
MTKNITSPQLPPKDGYVEVENSGVREYQKIEDPERNTLDNLVIQNSNLQNENRLLRAQIQAQSDRSDFIEDCLAEFASLVL